MKETGLMFKAPLVRAILEGRKTQTRRVLKPQPAPNHPHDGGTKWIIERGLHTPVGSVGHLSVREKMGLRCPMGQPGDRIYVRETHAHHPQFAQMAFRADGEEYEDADGWIWEPKWTPAIHMKKEEARIWLEITGVRVERLQSISESDCWKEGIEEVMHDFDNASQIDMAKRLGCCIDDAKPLFAQLWESTGGDWAANPWVWVIDFKTISTTGRPA